MVVRSAVDEFQVLSPGDPAQQRCARPDGDRVHAQAKLVQQRFVDQAPDQASTPDDVDRPAGLRFERAQFVEVANDPRGRPRGIAKGRREHQVRSLGRDPRVLDLAWVRVASQPLRDGCRVLSDRRPEHLVAGKHSGAEDERVDSGEQFEAVGPGVHPVGVPVRAEAVAVECDLHRRDERS